MSDNEPQTRITLRLPASLHESLLTAAAASNRSMNAEIIHRLEMTFSPYFFASFPVDGINISDGPNKKNIADLIEELRESIDKASSLANVVYLATKPVKDEVDISNPPDWD